MMAVIIACGVALIAALMGLGLGITALINPGWAGRLVRLQPDPDRREGGAELRANYGGLFTGLHVAPVLGLAGVLFGPLAGFFHDAQAQAVVAFGCLPLACGWFCLGLVRFVFARADGAVTRYNLLGAGFELGMGLALAAPAFVVMTP